MTVSLHQIGCPGSCERVKLCPCVLCHALAHSVSNFIELQECVKNVKNG